MKTAKLCNLRKTGKRQNRPSKSFFFWGGILGSRLFFNFVIWKNVAIFFQNISKFSRKKISLENETFPYFPENICWKYKKIVGKFSLIGCLEILFYFFIWLMIIMQFSLIWKIISQLPKANISTKSNVVCPSHEYGKAIFPNFFHVLVLGFLQVHRWNFWISSLSWNKDYLPNNGGWGFSVIKCLHFD